MVVGCLWMILCAIHWEKLILLQYIISSIIFLGMVESITWYFDFLYYNHHANFHFSAILVGILSSTLKRTSSRFPFPFSFLLFSCSSLFFFSSSFSPPPLPPPPPPPPPLPPPPPPPPKEKKRRRTTRGS